MIFFLIILVYVAINLYIGWNGLFLLSYLDYPFSPIIYWLLFWLVAFSYLFGRVRFLRGPIGRLLKVIGSYYFGILEFALLLLPLADLAGWLLKRSGFDSAFYVPTISAVFIVFFIILFLRGAWNAWSPMIRKHEISLNKKAGDLKELRIAVVSDIHLGNLVGKRHLRRLVQRINNINPDLILLPGDVIDDDIEPFIRNQMSNVMKHLHAPFGIYAVLGNHEYYGGKIAEFERQMNAIDIRVLKDEVVFVKDSFYIVGRKDRTAERMDPDGRLPIEALVSDLDVMHPVIVMDHQPYNFDKAAAAGVDLLLCGHTHRGQFAPNHWITKRLFELDWGYLEKDKMHVIVSSGYGTWGPPIRLASRSEIVEIVVRFEPLARNLLH